MIRKSAIALSTAVVLGIASPSFAQSFSPGDGTGNLLPFSYGPGGAKQRSPFVAPENSPVVGPQFGHGLFNQVGPQSKQAPAQRQ